MGSIDLNKIVEFYLDHSLTYSNLLQQKGRPQASFHKINYRVLNDTLVWTNETVKPCHLIEGQLPVQEWNSLRVSNKTHALEDRSCLTLNKGVIVGYDKPVVISAPDYFGFNSFILWPRQQKTESKKNVNATLKTGHKTTAFETPSQAFLQVKKTVYEGYFSAQARLSGNVIFYNGCKYNNDLPISHIVQELKEYISELERMNNVSGVLKAEIDEIRDVQKLKIERDEQDLTVYAAWEMQGKATIAWDSLYVNWL
ncbi:uncharacterized protein LOC106076083 [Biomphalaria glabrata]|uniref:Uncharacterized protein LOC106076083 n=1 Tax=Biomphalaria glabrata TaxID=6526 RepID=A0A9W3BIG7_BIOGL|nr:uncharacterized protein LOC106076083 [Biomphalaria glabrata]XP_055899231.1 uncharacterized protein LOC106076083 [Biomphalaria glabrata]